MKALSKNTKVILSIGGLAVLTTIILVLVRKKKTTVIPSVVGSDGQIVSAKVTTSIAWPIKRKAGALTNEDEKAVIMNIQKYLNDNLIVPYQPLVVDGIFGPLTEDASKRILGISTISYSLYNDTILPGVSGRSSKLI